MKLGSNRYLDCGQTICPISRHLVVFTDSWPQGFGEEKRLSYPAPLSRQNVSQNSSFSSIL